MNNLHRELAPISDVAWAQIEEETSRPDGARRPLLLRDDCGGRGNGSKATALVYVGARAPYAGEEDIALAPQAALSSATIGAGQLSEEAFLHDFAGDLPPEEARVLRCREMPA
jgi:hypothetical protein